MAGLVGILGNPYQFDHISIQDALLVVLLVRNAHYLLQHVIIRNAEKGKAVYNNDIL